MPGCISLNFTWFCCMERLEAHPCRLKLSASLLNQGINAKDTLGVEFILVKLQ